jgi:hypothetical protein
VVTIRTFAPITRTQKISSSNSSSAAEAPQQQQQQAALTTCCLNDHTLHRFCSRVEAMFMLARPTPDPHHPPAVCRSHVVGIHTPDTHQPQARPITSTRVQPSSLRPRTWQKHLSHGLAL